MESAVQWYRGRVKGVPSGDCLIIVAINSSKPGPPPEKTLTLTSVLAPRLTRRAGVLDEPFAWESREFLRKLCIGQDVTFRVDNSNPSINRDFGTVFLGDKNVAMLVVAEGWGKVTGQAQRSREVSPYVAELLRLEEQAKQQGLGQWNKAPGAALASIRDLPPSAIGDSSNFDALSLLNANKGRSLEAFVEQIRDGSTLRVYLLPEFQFVQVFVAGTQAPSMGRRAASQVVVETDAAKKSNSSVSSEPLGEFKSVQKLAVPASAQKHELPASVQKTTVAVSAQKSAVPTSAQKLVASANVEVAPDQFATEAKNFTEMRVLHREVRIILEGVDKFSNIIGSVFYSDGEKAKDLALELIENGYAKYVEWSANMMEEEPKRRLKTAELQAKKTRLRIWTNYVPPPSNSKPIHDQNFTGKVIEVVSGDCIVVADDSTNVERRVNLSSIRCPKMGNPRRDEKPAAYAREAKEFLRTRLIGKQVAVQMEYARKVTPGEGLVPSTAAAASEARIMEFGSVFLLSSVKAEGDGTAPPTAGSPQGLNVGELVVARGFGQVIRHRDFEERSNCYDGLLAAEARAIAGKKGLHSNKEPPPMHVTDLLNAAPKKAKDFLPFLQRSKRIQAVVEYVLSGHRFKLMIPKETCSIAFSFSGVRCPGRQEPYSDEAIAVMRRKIKQRDVEIEVETVDRTGTFLGSMWESKTNVALTLLQAGLARLQTAFGTDRIPEFHILEQAEKFAKDKKLKIWEKYVEGEEVSSGPAVPETKQKEALQVTVTEVLGGGKFYVQTVGDQRVDTIQQHLASLNILDAPIMGAFNPKKGDLVLCSYHADNGWYRAMIVNVPRGGVTSPTDEFEVFYIDYGNQEIVAYSQIRPLDPSVSTSPGVAQLCNLAYIKVPSLGADFGEEAAEFLSTETLATSKEFRAVIEEKDTSGGKVKGQGTGTVLNVTLIAVDSEISINAAMLQEGLARLEKRRRWFSKENHIAWENLEPFQEEARTNRRGIWQYGDVQSDDEDIVPVPSRKAGARR